MSHILLPWPSRDVHPNSRPHFMAKARATKRMRRDAYYAAKAAGVRVDAPEGPIAVKVTFYPPNKRKRDEDGCTASCKAYLDGIAEALGVDDNRFRLSYEFPDLCVFEGEVKFEVVG